MSEMLEQAKAAVRDTQGCGLTRDGKLVYCDQCDCEQVALAVIAAIKPYVQDARPCRAPVNYQGVGTW